jgi:hypothetical protein
MKLASSQLILYLVVATANGQDWGQETQQENQQETQQDETRAGQSTENTVQ